MEDDAWAGFAGFVETDDRSVCGESRAQGDRRRERTRAGARRHDAHAATTARPSPRRTRPGRRQPTQGLRARGRPRRLLGRDRVIERPAPVAPEIWQRLLGLLLDGLRADAATPLPDSSADARRSSTGSPRRGLRESTTPASLTDAPLTGSRAQDGLHRAHARHVPRRARPDDRLHRAADDRRRPRRPRPPLLGRHGVPARLDRLDAALRQARRHVRAQARLPRRDPDLPRRLDARGPEPVDGPADRVPRAPGNRRRRPDGRRAGDHRRHRPAARARPLHGPDRLRVRRRLGRRPAARRLPRRQPLVALGLLREHADRSGRRGDRRPAAPPPHPADAPSDRLSRCRAAQRRGRPRSSSPSTWGGNQYAWGSATILGLLGVGARPRRRVHLAGAPRAGADHPAEPVPVSACSTSRARWASRSGWRCSVRSSTSPSSSSSSTAPARRARACGCCR